MASLMFAQNVLSEKAEGSKHHGVFTRRNGGAQERSHPLLRAKVREMLSEEQDTLQYITAAVVCSSAKERKQNGPMKQICRFFSVPLLSAPFSFDAILP